jgi:hypothetical protein
MLPQLAGKPKNSLNQGPGLNFFFLRAVKGPFIITPPGIFGVTTSTKGKNPKKWPKIPLDPEKKNPAHIRLFPLHAESGILRSRRLRIPTTSARFPAVTTGRDDFIGVHWRSAHRCVRLSPPRAPHPCLLLPSSQTIVKVTIWCSFGVIKLYTCTWLGTQKVQLLCIKCV